MRPKIDIEKIKHLPTTEDLLVEEYGSKGTSKREEFEAKARAWYYAEVLKDARKAAGITQQQQAEKLVKGANMWLCLKREKQTCNSLLIS